MNIELLGTKFLWQNKNNVNATRVLNRRFSDVPPLVHKIFEGGMQRRSNLYILSRIKQIIDIYSQLCQSSGTATVNLFLIYVHNTI